MPPESIDADPTSLPRSFRGYDPQPTEELFRRVAWEYAVLAGEHRKLKKSMEDQQTAPAPRRGDLDEVARSALIAAHKTVREMRESARDECERALKKAKARAAEIEEEAERAAADAVAVMEAATVLRSTLREALGRLERGEPVSAPAPAASSKPEGNSNGTARRPRDLARRSTPSVP